MNIYGRFHKHKFTNQMRFTKSILELLEGVESVGRFFLYTLGFLLIASICVLVLIFWAIKNRFL